MYGVRGQRDEDRFDGVHEVPDEEVPLGRIQIPGIQDRGPEAAQRRTQLLLDEPGHDLLLGPQLRAAGPEYLGRGQAVIPALAPAPSDLPDEAADPLHREFVVDHAHDPGELDPLQERLLRVLGQGTDWALGTEARSRALLSEGQTAENCYREAIERLGRTRMRPALARAHLVYGEWLRRENRRRDARAELRTAYGLFTTMGIEAFAERARRELLAIGGTVRKRTVETVSELTAQEAHIARLAVDGRTNVEIGTQLFLSTRTVEWHLGKVYSKLSVSSRRDLRRAMASTGHPYR